MGPWQLYEEIGLFYILELRTRKELELGLEEIMIVIILWTR